MLTIVGRKTINQLKRKAPNNLPITKIIVIKFKNPKFMNFNPPKSMFFYAPIQCICNVYDA